MYHNQTRVPLATWSVLQPQKTKVIEHTLLICEPELRGKRFVCGADMGCMRIRNKPEKFISNKPSLFSQA